MKENLKIRDLTLYKKLLPVALLIIAGFLAYHDTMVFPFVFDDKPAILENATIHQFRTAFLPPADGSSVTGRPFVNFTFAVNYAISGETVGSYHALNLLIHLGAGLALFGILWRTLELKALPERFRISALPLAFTIAALWVVHPLQTESVTSVIQRTESLVGLFYLLTLYGFIRSVDSTSNQRLWSAFSVVACLLGMATKEVMVTAPLLVLLYDRTFVAGSFASTYRLRRFYYLTIGCTWLLLVFLVSGAGGTRGAAAGFGLGVTPWNYALTQCHAVLLYLKLTFWPHPLVFDYGTVVARSFGGAWMQVVSLLLLVGGTVVAIVRHPKFGFVGASFFLILAPSSSVVPLVSQTVAEHRMYLPLAAVIALVVLLAYARLGRAVPLLALAIGPLLLTLTMQRNQDYRSELALWSDTVAKVPENARARINFAEVLIENGRPAEALEQASAAVALRPEYAEAQTNLGIALAQLGRLDDALGPCRRAVELSPDYFRGRSNLGVVYAQLGYWSKAIEQFEEGLRLAGNSRDALPIQGNLAKCLLQAGRLEEAIGHFTTVLKVMPDDVEMHFNLARALGLSGRFEEAEQHLETVLRLMPGHIAARNTLEAARAAR